LSGESVWVAFAYADGYCNRNAYSNAGTESYAHTAASSNASAAPLRLRI